MWPGTANFLWWSCCFVAEATWLPEAGKASPPRPAPCAALRLTRRPAMQRRKDCPQMGHRLQQGRCRRLPAQQRSAAVARLRLTPASAHCPPLPVFNKLSLPHPLPRIRVEFVAAAGRIASRSTRLQCCGGGTGRIFVFNFERVQQRGKEVAIGGAVHTVWARDWGLQ